MVITKYSFNNITQILDKIINNCLFKVILENKILQGYQFALLSLMLTFKLLRIINDTVQTNNNELWILKLN